MRGKSRDPRVGGAGDDVSGAGAPEFSFKPANPRRGPVEEVDFDGSGDGARQSHKVLRGKGHYVSVGAKNRSVAQEERGGGRADGSARGRSRTLPKEVIERLASSVGDEAGFVKEAPLEGLPQPLPCDQTVVSRVGARDARGHDGPVGGRYKS